MARRKRLEGAAQRWAGDAESVWTGMADWRAAHPKATLSEIETALDEQLNRLRARMLADLALASTAADVPAAVTLSGIAGTSPGSVMETVSGNASSPNETGTAGSSFAFAPLPSLRSLGETAADEVPDAPRSAAGSTAR